MDQGMNINRSHRVNNVAKKQVNTLESFSLFYSIKKSEIERALNIKFSNLATARIALILLIHLNKYHRNIKHDFRKLYGFCPLTLDKAIEKLLSSGMTQTVNCKRKTNLGLYVSLTSYQITQPAIQILIQFNFSIEQKINKISKL